MKKIVLIGGGHGLSNLVKGFKNEDVDLSIVVSSTDDGGHTGIIREEFDCVALGDLRMILNEFIGEKSSLKEVFDYRFDNLHGVNGVSIGNVMILSLLNKYKDINAVIEYFRSKENIKPNIYLSNDSPLTLCARCCDNDIVKCERNIGLSNKDFNKIYVEGEIDCNKDMLNRLEMADTIVLTPGSLYTSICSVLCIDEIKKAILRSNASIVYVCNIMEQYGETKGYSVNKHVEVLETLLGKRIDRVIVNNGTIDDEILDRYKEENSKVVELESINDNFEFYNLVEIKDGKVRHNSELTKKIILNQ